MQAIDPRVEPREALKSDAGRERRSPMPKRNS